jgi:hypothetical protein
MISKRPGSRDWAIGLLVSALLGLVLLGAGGRMGMRVIALANRQTPILTIGGTLAVTLLGAATGLAVGAIFLLSRTAAPRRRIARVGLFTGVCAFLVLRGLRPVTVLNLSVFAPLFVVHAVLLHLYWCRIHMRRRIGEP